jgi:fumarate reductase subunit D
MSWLKLATIILSLYILFESFCAMAKMPGGMIHFCHKIKYVLAFSSSIVFIYYSVMLCADEAWQWLLFGSAGTLAFFVWPRTVHRFKSMMKDYEDIEASLL